MWTSDAAAEADILWSILKLMLDNLRGTRQPRAELFVGGYARGRDLPKVTLPLSKLNDHGIGGCKEGRIRTWLLTLPHTAKSNHLRRHVRPQKTWPC